MKTSPAVIPALLYAAGFQLDRRLDGLRLGWRPPRPVIAVGGLTVGGAGKTPFTAWLAGELLRRGARPAAVTRGYGGAWARRSAVPAVVFDGERLLLEAAEAGDEAVELARRLPGVPVVIGRVKGRAADLAARLPGVSLVLVDDALQHLRLARDFEIAVLRGGEWTARVWRSGRLLPWGRLREPFNRLERVDAVAVYSPEAEELRQLRLRFPRALVFAVERRSAGLVTGDGRRLPLETLRGLPVIAFAGIVHPDAFFADLSSAGAVLAEVRRYPDHAVYDTRRLAELRSLAAGRPDARLVTTAKDAVKLPPDLPHYVLEQKLTPEAGAGERLVEKILRLRGEENRG